MAIMTIALAAGHEIVLSADGGRFETAASVEKWHLLSDTTSSAKPEPIMCRGSAPSATELSGGNAMCWWDNTHSFEYVWLHIALCVCNVHVVGISCVVLFNVVNTCFLNSILGRTFMY